MTEVSNSNQLERIVQNFTAVLLLIVGIPSFIIWQLAETIISVWLHNPELSSMVNNHAKVILPAFTIGSLCYVPVVLLLAVQDFKYQAITSAGMTLASLGLVTVCAINNRIDLVGYIYFFYFVTASISVWARSLYLKSTRQLAIISMTNSIIPIFIIISFVASFSVMT
jgi:hypothetical protein